MKLTRSPGLILGVVAVLLIGLFVYRGFLGDVGIPLTGGASGQAFVASAVDHNDCPIQLATQFTNNQSIYTGFTATSIPQGTRMFARLSRNRQTLEDAREVTVSQPKQTCVSFVFKPAQSEAGFQPGDYQVDLFVNGSRAQTVQFTVNQANGGTRSRNQLSQLVLTDHVDGTGCPGDNIAVFRSDQPVYAAYDRSFVLAGTKLFARLSQAGQTLEDTKQITVDQDMSSCIWFVFPDKARGGLNPGSYTVQTYVNGNRVDSAQFTVR